MATGKQTQDLLERGIEQILVKSELEKIMNSGKKLRIYYGVDPSGPVIHLGHAVILRRLGQFQSLGHKIIFLVGDFTGMIGDPTDRDAVRQPLTRQEVLENAKTYKKQVEKFLRFDGKNAAELRFNSEWNDKLSFRDYAQIASRFTVQQLLEREMYQKRIKDQKPISLLEFLYPTIQGYDAVMLDADMQVGGTDQLFNMIQGRNLMKSLKNKSQMVLTFKLLEGTDGRKMSKSFNNIIAVGDSPNEMYGKVMSIKDELIIEYFRLTTDVALTDIKKMENALKAGENPRDLKAKLAHEIVKLYYDAGSAKRAANHFQKTVVKKENPDKISSWAYAGGNPKEKLYDLLVWTGLCDSKSEARRMIEQGGVRIDGAVIGDRDAVITPAKGLIIQAGKRKFVKIK